MVAPISCAERSAAAELTAAERHKNTRTRQNRTTNVPLCTSAVCGKPPVNQRCRVAKISCVRDADLALRLVPNPVDGRFERMHRIVFDRFGEILFVGVPVHEQDWREELLAVPAQFA